MDLSFLNPKYDSKGNLYAPRRFKEIVKECWYISDNIHTSYNEVLELSYYERVALIDCINEKLNATKKAIEDMESKRQNKK